MRILPLLLFIIVPLAELAILIKLGEIIGVAATILLVIGTAVLGVSLLKRQGLAALARARSSVDAGELPIESVIDGVCLLVAGAFLLTPGLLTDTIGFSLLVPALRRRMAYWIFDKLKSSGVMRFHKYETGPDAPGPGQRPPPRDTVIDGEFEDLDDHPPETKPPRIKASDRNASPWRK